MDREYMSKREMRGQSIAKSKQIQKTEGGWLVPSASSDKKYLVGTDFDCNCPDAQFHKQTCKHAYAVRFYLAKETDTPNGTKTEKMRLTYKQAWHSYNSAQKEEITQFDKLLRDLVQEVDEPAQEFGRPRLSLQEMVFCSVQKVYSQLSSRRAYSLFGKATDNGLINHAPYYNGVSAFLNTDEATPILMSLVGLSAAPLKSVETSFAVDSTGFRTTNFSMYANAKYGLQRKHKFVKAHACVGTKTNVITAVAITGEDGADSPQFADLVNNTAADGFDVQEVSADKAYSSRENHALVKRLGGQAYIPFKSNATGKSQGSMAWRKAFLYFQLNADEFYQHYHKRSNVESAFSSIKAKFGDALRSKKYAAQVNELLCKVIAYNVVVLIHEMEELGISPNFNLPVKSHVCL